MNELKFKKTGVVKTPFIGTEESAGIDLFMPEDVMIPPHCKKLVDLMIAVEIPVGYVGILSQRSSTGKIDVSLANTIGWIDSDYRGSIKAYVKHIPAVPMELKDEKPGMIMGSLWLPKGERIFQLVIVPFYKVHSLIEVEELSSTTRTGGFGSTGQG